jgi:hypothetical protein
MKWTLKTRAPRRAATPGRHAGPSSQWEGPLRADACGSRGPSSSSTRSRDGRQVRGQPGEPVKGRDFCNAPPPPVEVVPSLPDRRAPQYGAHVSVSKSQRHIRKYGVPQFTAASCQLEKRGLYSVKIRAESQAHSVVGCDAREWRRLETSDDDPVLVKTSNCWRLEQPGYVLCLRKSVSVACSYGPASERRTRLHRCRMQPCNWGLTCAKESEKLLRQSPCHCWIYSNCRMSPAPFLSSHGRRKCYSTYCWVRRCSVRLYFLFQIVRRFEFYRCIDFTMHLHKANN